MKQLYCVTIDPSTTSEEAWQSLEALGLDILYATEENHLHQLYVYAESPQALNVSWIASYSPYTLPATDWEAQWKLNSPQFFDGCAHIELNGLDVLKLQPGSGFGDLSHPTTQLMLTLLSKYLNRTHPILIDIGCGSGILTLAAAKLGATYAYGIDIDPESISHSKQNAVLNRLKRRCQFCLPQDFDWHPSSQKPLILMNMIATEQKQAWDSLSILHGQQGRLITSGIRNEELEKYLFWTQSLGWKLVEKQENADWLAFCFDL